MDQWTFMRRKLTEEELPDKHLRQDKVGGLFPFDHDSDGPKITPKNSDGRAVQVGRGGGPIYLYQSSTLGLYLHYYR